MPLKTLGINHTTADLDLREALAFAPDQLQPAIQSAQQSGVSEVAILSTCNRTEIYCNTELNSEQLVAWLAQYKNLDLEKLMSASYMHENAEAVRHMMKVAGGLDSLVLGEPQILGQMKSAYAVAKDAGSIDSILHDAFQSVFSVAKKIRSDTAIGQNPVSVAYAAVALAQQIFSDLKEGTALLIGAGETIELVAKHLSDQGIKKIIVANRTLKNALSLAQTFDAEAILLSDIPEHLYLADIVIASTASQLPLLGKGAVENALKRRKFRAMFMVDIAVPRDIEPQVGELDDVYLYTVDDLKTVIDSNMRSRQEAAKIAQNIIAGGVENFQRVQREMSAVNTVKRLRDHINGLKDEELNKAKALIEKGADVDEVLTQLARALTNKFLHLPTANLRQAGAENRQDLIDNFEGIMLSSKIKYNSEQGLEQDLEQGLERNLKRRKNEK